MSGTFYVSLVVGIVVGLILSSWWRAAAVRLNMIRIIGVMKAGGGTVSGEYLQRTAPWYHKAFILVTAVVRLKEAELIEELKPNKKLFSLGGEYRLTFAGVQAYKKYEKDEKYMVG